MKLHRLGKIFFLALLTIGTSSCNKQNRLSKVVINEVMTDNQSNFTDDYGQRNGWIELFNRSYGSLDLAGYSIKVCNTAGDTLKYTIPKGDVQTIIKPQQHALFWTDGIASRGTFHTNLALAKDKDNWIGLYDNSGILLNEITIPNGILKADESYARTSDAAEGWEVRGINSKLNVTPSTNNTTLVSNPKGKKFSEQDEHGYGMALTAMSVVFSGLLILFISFKIISIIAVSTGKKIIHKSGHAYTTVKKVVVNAATLNKKSNETETDATAAGASQNEEEIQAAIAMALHEYLGANTHDEESHVLTILPAQTAWNDHNTTLREIPQRSY